MLGQDYNIIEEDYKLCSEGCKQAREGESNCNAKCGAAFSNSVKLLYDNFYRKRVGGRKEYKKVKN